MVFRKYNKEKKSMNTNFNSFTELSINEMENVNGGWDWGTVIGGAALVVGCIAVAATAPVSLPALAGGALCIASGVGGVAVGWGATH